MQLRRSPNRAGHTPPQHGRDRLEQVVAISRYAHMGGAPLAYLMGPGSDLRIRHHCLMATLIRSFSLLRYG